MVKLTSDSIGAPEVPFPKSTRADRAVKTKQFAELRSRYAQSSISIFVKCPMYLYSTSFILAAYGVIILQSALQSDSVFPLCVLISHQDSEQGVVPVGNRELFHSIVTF
jgi:hypothetical protein